MKNKKSNNGYPLKMFPFGKTKYPVCPYCKGEGGFSALVYHPDYYDGEEHWDFTICSHCEGSGVDIEHC